MTTKQLARVVGLGLICARGLVPPAAGECPKQWLHGPEVGLPGVNGTVYALAVYDDGRGPALYAGGNFTIAGHVAAKYIAKWNGTIWAPLGSGMSGHVYALAVYNGELIAGGNFTSAGGVSASRIARWDGRSWVPLDSGVNNEVAALTVYNGELIVGG